MNPDKLYYEHQFYIYEMRLPFILLLTVVSVYGIAQTVPRTYVAQYTNQSITVDGEMEQEWDDVEWTVDFIDIEGEITPKYKTRVKMLWDSTYLYFYADLFEPHVWGDIAERDAVIFYNNDFEVFIDPDGDTHNYMEFEINALNTFWDLFLTKPYRNGPRVIDNWDIKGIKTAVKINGTLNDPSDVDEGWNVEIAMPWSALLEATTNELPVNDYWRINFSRVNWDYELENKIYIRKKDENGQYLPEYNWVWSPQRVINMHEPEHWGFVYFSQGPEDFEAPSDELLKRKLYEVYRSIHERKLNLEDSDYFTVTFQNQEIPVHFERHLTGWNIWIVSPNTDKRIAIKEDGKSSISIN